MAEELNRKADHLSVDCDKAEKHGELCLGYGGDEDEPCEQCKNCIKCETGYYQLGETEKDEQLNKLQEENEQLKKLFANCDTCRRTCDIGNCCKSGNAYLPDTEKILNKNKQLTEAKEILKMFVNANKLLDMFNAQKKAEVFLEE